ncbi:MAG: RNA-binding S4 domain-containing protein [Flavobacteriales bacterium]|nr:RNA-binding S4 domain-containing protein [Flavobacteriales bacterium]
MKKIEFSLTQDFIELMKLLKLLGLVETGGHAKIVIEEGLVRYNNEVEFRKRKKLFKGDVVQFNNHQINII